MFRVFTNIHMALSFTANFMFLSYATLSFHTIISRKSDCVLMRRLFTVLVLFPVLILTLFHAPIVIHGANIGLELWYSSVLPSILPFMIITSLLLQQIPNKNICFLGLLCGLPIGANLIRQQLTGQHLSLSKANILLCICNITSPMFISGYILHQTLSGQISALRFLLCIYTPLALYAIPAFLLQAFQKPDSGRFHKIHASAITHLADATSAITPSASTSAKSPIAPGTRSPVSLDSIVRQSLETILKIGIYIMLFCILIEFILTFLPSDLAILRYAAASLEITNGIQLIATASLSLQQKTALIAGLTSFGGICSILQTQSVIHNSGLSISHYTIVKLCMGITSYFLALFLCA